MTDFIADDAKEDSEWFGIEQANKIANEMLPSVPLRNWRGLSKMENEFSVPLHETAISADVMLSMRLTFAAHMLKEVVEIDRDKAHGVPVLAGTRFKIARILAELADGITVTKMAREFNLDKRKIVDLLRGLAIQLDRPFSR